MITRMTRTVLGLWIGALLTTTGIRGADWQRWRGPDMNGVSKETGWSATWPDEGPKRLLENFGRHGLFFHVREPGARVYTLGNDGDKTDTIYCFDAATGASVWKHPYACVLDPKYYEGGPSCTPTVEDGRVYTLSRQGDLLCLDAATGTLIWNKKCEGGLWRGNSDLGFRGFAGGGR